MHLLLLKHNNPFGQDMNKCDIAYELHGLDLYNQVENDIYPEEWEMDEDSENENENQNQTKNENENENEKIKDKNILCQTMQNIQNYFLS